MKFRPFPASRWFEPGQPATRYPPEMPANGISGVYAIADLKGKILYVGYSRSARLRDTIGRHLRQWEGERAGPSYPRARVQIAWREYDPDAVDIYELESQAIDWYNPRDNDLTPVEDEPPF